MEQKPVGIWIRVSTEDQAKGESPEHHEKRARYYAESKGWNIKQVYHLEAVSGKSVMEHAETQKMLKDIKSGDHTHEETHVPIPNTTVKLMRPMIVPKSVKVGHCRAF